MGSGTEGVWLFVLELSKLFAFLRFLRSSKLCLGFLSLKLTLSLLLVELAVAKDGVLLSGLGSVF